MSTAQLVGVNGTTNLSGKFSEFRDLVQGYLSGEFINKKYVDDKIKQLIDDAPDDMNTLGEIAKVIQILADQSAEDKEKIVKLEKVIETIQVAILGIEEINNQTILMYRKLGYKD